MTVSLPPLRDVIARHGLSASKALGQNFLFDEKLLDRIAAIPGSLVGEHVYEVGPGPGGLTRALLRAGAHVVAVKWFTWDNGATSEEHVRELKLLSKAQ